MPRLVLPLLLGCVAAVAVVDAAPDANPAPLPLPPARVVEVDLEADLAGATLRQVEIIQLLIRAARIVDGLYREQLEGSGFYPPDLDAEEFASWEDPGAGSPYTVVRRNPAGRLEAVPYHEAWPREIGQLARLLAQAGEITNDLALRHYLTQRARALITGDYGRAEAAWQAMRDSDLDVLIGPIGTDADQRFGLKSGFGAYLMLRDWAWGARLAHYTVFLPRMQQDLPVSDAFKAEVPDVGMKVAVYDLLYHAGYGAARVDAPRPVEAADLRLRLRQGPRRLHLRNVARARFDAMVRPVAEVLVAPGQRREVHFDAFFLNTMFHEMSQSLGLRDTLAGRGPVREALREHADTIEEAKGLVLSLWLAAWLQREGELTETSLAEHHASFLAGLFSTLHLDPDGPRGRARLLVLNHLRDWGAVRRDAAEGTWRVEAAELEPAIDALTAQLLTLQGSGDYEGAAELLETLAVPRAELRSDLERLAATDIPQAVLFRQGEYLLGL